MTNKLWLGLVKIIGNKSSIWKGGGYDLKKIKVKLTLALNVIIRDCKILQYTVNVIPEDAGR